MPEKIKYTVFTTELGFFGFAATEIGLYRTILPFPNREKVEKALLTGIENSIFDPTLMPKLQKKIIAYFNGQCVNFDNFKLDLADLSPFAASVLTACRKITFGQTISYGRLADLANHPRAARAVGTALGNNPLPLIIPCHRIIPTTGRIGNFSALAGTKLKQKMLQIEKS